MLPVNEFTAGVVDERSVSVRCLHFLGGVFRVQRAVDGAAGVRVTDHATADDAREHLLSFGAALVESRDEPRPIPQSWMHQWAARPSSGAGRTSVDVRSAVDAAQAALDALPD